MALLATIGYIVPEYATRPGNLSPSSVLTFEGVPKGLRAFSEGLTRIFLFAGFIELVHNKPTKEPGNYGKGFLGRCSGGVGSYIQTPSVPNMKLAAELAKGRLARMAIIGMFYQDGLTGSAGGGWALYGRHAFGRREDNTSAPESPRSRPEVAPESPWLGERQLPPPQKKVHTRKARR